MSSRVLVALRVKASPQRAFDAFVGEIGAWWRPNALFQTQPGGPGRLAFEGGPDGRLLETNAGGGAFEIGRIRRWEPPSRLIFSYRQASFPPGFETEVEVQFEAVGGETRVSVEHRGFDQLPQGSAARHGFPDRALLMRLAEWWRAQLASLDRIA